MLIIVKTFKHWRHYVEESFHTIKVLTDHNNLKKFIKIRKLNKRQTRWVIKLLSYDFSIVYKLNKTNLINALFKRSNYYTENITINWLLLILQQKLIRIKNLNKLIFKVIKNIYNTRTKDTQRVAVFRIKDILRITVVSANTRRTEDVVKTAIHSNHIVNIYWLTNNVKSLLLRIFKAAVRATHLNTVYLLKLKNSQVVKTSDTDEILIKINPNVIEKQLNFVVETVDYKQLVSRTIVILMTMYKTTYNFNSKFIIKLIKTLQLEDKFFIKIKADEVINKQKDIKTWSVNNWKILKYNKKLYVFKDATIREELLKQHHDNVLTKHFDAKKTKKLLSRKYN